MILITVLAVALSLATVVAAAGWLLTKMAPPDFHEYAASVAAEQEAMLARHKVKDVLRMHTFEDIGLELEEIRIRALSGGDKLLIMTWPDSDNSPTEAAMWLLETLSPASDRKAVCTEWDLITNSVTFHWLALAPVEMHVPTRLEELYSVSSA